jgi:DNA-binding NtrC family response regulator
MKAQFEGLVDHLISGGLFLEQAVELLEKTMIARTLENSAGNRCAAAKKLGIHRNTLRRKMEEYSLGRTRRKPAVTERGGARRRKRKAS